MKFFEELFRKKFKTVLLPQNNSVETLDKIVCSWNTDSPRREVFARKPKEGSLALENAPAYECPQEFQAPAMKK